MPKKHFWHADDLLPGALADPAADSADLLFAALPGLLVGGKKADLLHVILDYIADGGEKRGGAEPAEG